MNRTAPATPIENGLRESDLNDATVTIEKIELDTVVDLAKNAVNVCGG